MARTASGESQDLTWAARGCEAISFFVFVLYSSKAAVKIASKLVGAVEVDGSSDMVLVEGDRLDASEDDGMVAPKGTNTGDAGLPPSESCTVREQGAVIFAGS